MDPDTLPTSGSSDVDAEMHAELAALRRIRRVHQEHLDRARRAAERLADEAAEASEEGIRDLVDEDAEVDAAVRAALVRQTSDRAMYAFRRVSELEAQGKALAFGHTTFEDGERRYVGRLSVLDGDDALLVDWRARAAIPFYRATPLDRLEVTHRRHLLYGSGAEEGIPENYSDEVFDPAALDDHTHLRGEAALLAALSAPTEEQMRSVVATIQSEQDAVIRAPSTGPLVVQGGPGTGKTVVALHRAAYLLYDQRADLADTGVLIVGPTTEFLTYIASVLPSLGETGVISVTPTGLFPGVRLGAHEPPEVSEIKGRAEMAPLLANAIADRQRRPVSHLEVFYGSRRVTVEQAELAASFDQAKRHATHNDGANSFRRSVLDALCRSVYDPAFANTADARESFADSRLVEEFLLRHWPPLTPERALNDLLGSNALLQSAARTTSLTQKEIRSLHRERANDRQLPDRRWTEADVPLLDELLVLVGGSLGGQTEEERIRERDAQDEFELAEVADESEVEGPDPVEQDEEEMDELSLDEFMERFE